MDNHNEWISNAGVYSNKEWPSTRTQILVDWPIVVLEQKRMIADFAQLHQRVHQRLLLHLHAVRKAALALCKLCRINHSKHHCLYTPLYAPYFVLGPQHQHRPIDHLLVEHTLQRAHVAAQHAFGLERTKE